MKYVTLTDVSRKPLDMRLQTNHHALLFVVTHSYPTCPLPTSPLDLFEGASFEIGHRTLNGPSNLRIIGCISMSSSLDVSAIFALPHQAACCSVSVAHAAGH